MQSMRSQALKSDSLDSDSCSIAYDLHQFLYPYSAGNHKPTGRLVLLQDYTRSFFPQVASNDNVGCR